MLLKKLDKHRLIRVLKLFFTDNKEFRRRFKDYISFSIYNYLNKIITKFRAASPLFLKKTSDGRYYFQDDYYFSIAKTDEPIKFLISSAGNSGSLWLAQSLHMHPDILSTAGVDNPVISMNYYYNQYELDQIYLKLLENKIRNYGFCNSKYFISDYIAVYNKLKEEKEKNNIVLNCKIEDFFSSRNNPKFCSWIFDELLDLTKIKPAKMIGNVHGATLNLIHSNYSYLNNSNTKLAELSRNPILRKESTITNYVATYHRSDDFKTMVDSIFINEMSKIKFYEKNFDVDFSLTRNKCNLYLETVIKYTKSIADEYKNYFLPVFHFEKIRSDAEYFSSIISYLSDFNLNCDDDYLTKVFSNENLNSGRIGGNTPSNISSRDLYFSWHEWERHLFSSEVVNNDIAKTYLKIGYDISFVKL